MHYFEATHPKNGSDVTIAYDEDLKLVSATYSSDGEEVDLTDSIKQRFLSEINQYHLTS